jgi:hypothetical protein
MSTSVPEYLLEEIRQEIIDETKYTDNELLTFIRNSIKHTNFILRTNHFIIEDEDSIYSYTINGTPNNDFWEVVKWRAICMLLDNYYKHLVATGVGISISLGSERIDSKTVLITVKDAVKESQSVYKGLAAAYNMLYRRARIVG